MSKKLSWIEKCSNGIRAFSKILTETGGKIHDSVVKVNFATKIALIEQIVAHEVRRVELKTKHPDIDFEAIEAELDYGKNSNTEVKPKSSNIEHMVGTEDLIAELKVKHPNLDWVALEEKIIEELRY